MPSLTIMEPDKEARMIALGTEPLRVGRSALKCGLVFDFIGISSQHCEISVMGDTYKVADLNSANHTYVNGRAITELQLNDGDRIIIGTITITFNNELQPKKKFEPQPEPEPERKEKYWQRMAREGHSNWWFEVDSWINEDSETVQKGWELLNAHMAYIKIEQSRTEPKSSTDTSKQ